MTDLSEAYELLSRRKFFGHAAGAAAILVGGSKALGRTATRPEESIPKPCPPSAWQKHGVVIEATEPWEGESVLNVQTSAEPLDKDRWRIYYYNGNDVLAYAEGVPGEKMRKYRLERSSGRPADAPFALGNLPGHVKIRGYNHIRMNNGKHRLYCWVFAEPNAGIARCLVAESDDGRRYRMLDPNRPVLYHFNDRAAQGVPNYEGVMYPRKPNISRPADEPPAPPRLICNDVTSVYQLPDDTFEIYATSVIRVPENDPRYCPEDNSIGALRMIDRFTSEDGIHFENRRRAIEPDAEDPPDQQFYYLAVTYTPKGRVGMLGHYPARTTTMDIEWCFSRDGVKWHRPCRRPWVPRGGENRPDSCMILTGNSIAHHNGRYHLFYTGFNFTHNGKVAFEPRRAVIMYASTDSIWA